MKYIKMFERLDEIKNLKKYFVNSINDYYTLFEVKAIYYNSKIEIRRLYHCDTSFGKELIKDIITDNIENNFYMYKDSIVYTSDNLNDCLDFIKLRLDVNKYNI